VHHFDFADILSWCVLAHAVFVIAKTEKILEKLYMNPRKPSSLGGVERLYKAAKVIIPELEKTEVERFLQGKFAYSQHTQSKRKLRAFFKGV
jgi:hypothetical protein